MDFNGEVGNASLVVSRGELYFDPFEAGTTTRTGEKYLGNTPGFSLGRSLEQVKRARSYGGQIVPVRSVITQEVLSAKIQTDNIDVENLLTWLGAEVTASTQAAQANITETFRVQRGHWYQLGETVFAAGLRNLTGVPVFKKGGVDVPFAANLAVDPDNARFLVKSTATGIANGDTLSVTFSVDDADVALLDSAPRPAELLGAMRFIATNPIGARTSYFFPYVRLESASDMDLKKSDWLTLDFNVEIRRLNPSARHFYGTRRGAA